MANLILKEHDPHEIMKLGKRVTETDEWKKKEVPTMAVVIRKKFDQNPHLKDRLCRTKGNIYEATMHPIFGCGFSIPNCKKIILANIYRPPQGNVKTFCDTLEDKIDIINAQNRSADFFVLGVFNINYKANTNPETKTWKWFEQKMGFKQIISDITRYSNNDSCIDLIFTNSLFVYEKGTLDVNLSDHEMIFVTRKHIHKEKNSSTFQGRTYRHKNEALFLQHLTACNWNIFYQSDDPEIAWNILESNILNIINTMCPIQTFHVKHLKDPWISQEILEAMKDKDRLLSLAKRNNRAEDWVLARRRRNQVKIWLKMLNQNLSRII